MSKVMCQGSKRRRQMVVWGNVSGARGSKGRRQKGVWGSGVRGNVRVPL